MDNEVRNVQEWIRRLLLVGKHNVHWIVTPIGFDEDWSRKISVAQTMVHRKLFAPGWTEERVIYLSFFSSSASLPNLADCLPIFAWPLFFLPGTNPYLAWLKNFVLTERLLVSWLSLAVFGRLRNIVIAMIWISIGWIFLTLSEFEIESTVK